MTTTPPPDSQQTPATPDAVLESDTRPPLYDAFGDHSGEYHRRGDERRFLALFGIASLVIFAAVVGFNAAVDPYGTLGTGWVPPVESQNSERLGKVDLLEEMKPAPKALALGTSTMRMYDPHHQEQLSGDRTFNASVSGSSLRTAYAFVAFAHHRLNLKPHVVWGLDVEGLHKRPEQPLGDARLQRELPRTDRWSSRITALQPIVDLRTVDVSLKALQSRDDRKAPDTKGQRAIAQAHKLFDAHGFVKKDPLQGVDREGRLTTVTERYARDVYRNGGYTELDAKMQRYVRRTIELANSYGDTPTIVLMPLHPEAHKVLGPLGWDARRNDIRRFMHKLEEDGLKLHFEDMSDPATFHADTDKFHDGVHMHKKTMHRMMDELERRGAL